MSTYENVCTYEHIGGHDVGSFKIDRELMLATHFPILSNFIFYEIIKGMKSAYNNCCMAYVDDLIPQCNNTRDAKYGQVHLPVIIHATGSQSRNN